MALVAYSDESDISDEDEETSQVPSLKSFPNSDSVTVKRTIIPTATSKEKSDACSPSNKISLPSSNSTNGINAVPPSGIESIIDDDEDFIPMHGSADSSINRVLLSSLQAVPRTHASVSISNLTLDVGEDELMDVPTKETWKFTQDVLKKMADKSGDTKFAESGSSSSSAKNSAISSFTKSIAITSNSSSASSKDDDSAPIVHTLGKAQQIALASSALGSLLQKKKTQGGKVQLLLPALSELVEDNTEDAVVADQSIPAVTKKPAPSKAGTGLFSLLSKPKNLVKGKEANRSLVPHSLFKKPQPPGPLKSLQSPNAQYRGATLKNPEGFRNSYIKKSQVKSNLGSLGLPRGEQDDSDEEEDAAGATVDFFSLDSQDSHHLPPAGTSLLGVAGDEGSMIINEVDEASGVSSADTINRIPSLSNSNNIQGSLGVSTSTVCDDTPSKPCFSADGGGGGGQEDFIPMTSSHSIGSTTGMDDDAWRRLTGKKRKSEDIDIIDVNADDALLSREEWMNRAASQEKPSHSHSKKKGNLPSQQQKRKHQITYLAHQAKEREIELKNDWSSGKMKKQQTRAKYGF